MIYSESHAVSSVEIRRGGRKKQKELSLMVSTVTLLVFRFAGQVPGRESNILPLQSASDVGSDHKSIDKSVRPQCGRRTALSLAACGKSHFRPLIDAD